MAVPGAAGHADPEGAAGGGAAGSAGASAGQAAAAAAGVHRDARAGVAADGAVHGGARVAAGDAVVAGDDAARVSVAVVLCGGELAVADAAVDDGAAAAAALRLRALRPFSALWRVGLGGAAHAVAAAQDDELARGRVRARRAARKRQAVGAAHGARVQEPEHGREGVTGRAQRKSFELARAVEQLRDVARLQEALQMCLGAPAHSCISLAREMFAVCLWPVCVYKVCILFVYVYFVL